MKLKPGIKAPEFKSKDQNGNAVSLKDFRGSKLVLFFYPKDMTPTCTVEVCNLRDNYAKLKKAGYELVGVSADSEERHQRFVAKHALPFPLLADIDKTIIHAYGVWGSKKLFGNVVEGIRRTTFVVDEHGVIIEIIDKVKAVSHADQILAGVKKK